MKRVLITGAKGFIGRFCVPLLLQSGYEVHAVSSSEVMPHEGNVNWHKCNLLNETQQKELLKKVKPTHLLHLAWYTAHGLFWQAKENLDWLKASLHFFQTFAEEGGKRFVGSGTCAEYDFQAGYCIENTTPLKPSTLYGSAKNACQDILSHLSKQMDVNFAWGRVFHLYGPYEGEKRLVPSVILSLLKGNKALCSHGKQIRDLLYVEDVASAFVALLSSQVSGSVNIVSGQPAALHEVIQMIGRQLKRPEAICLGAIDAAKNDPPMLVGSSCRLHQEVGWQPQVDREAGISKTIHWWQAQCP